MTFQEGENVGPYRVLHKLGQGGMATVFKAYHASLDRYVALKILHTAFMEDPNFLARFDREAKVVANLDHPNIVPIYDFSEHNGSPYFVMKFVTGNTLKALLNSRPLSQGEGMRIIETVGAALAYAHKQGILHRDIKPSNVMISDDDQIYLTDFGLARIASAGESTLSSDMMLGTPQYISPEQALGKSQLDEGTDIYSFGVLVYELVVGQVPFSADTPYSIVHDHIYTALPLPSSVNPSVPESVERVLLKALSKEREDRYESVDAFISEFKAATHGEPLAEYWTDGQGVAGVAVPVPASAAPSSSDTLPPAESQTGAEQKPKRGFRWWYAIPIAFLLFLFLAVAGNVLDDRRSANAAAATEPLLIAEADQPDEGQPFADFDGPPESEADFPPLFDEALPGSGLEEALILVEEHLDDPVAYLELALAYFDIGQDEEAGYAYEQAQELAGEDPEFYLLAAELFRQRDVWPLVLEATLKAIAFTEGRPPTREMMSNLHQAAFQASDFQQPFVEDLLFSSLVFRHQQQAVPFAGLLAAQARYRLFEGNFEAANRLLQEALGLVPDFPVVVLVQAQLLFETGEIDEAVNLLLRLARPNLPNVDSWVRIEAENLLNQIES